MLISNYFKQPGLTEKKWCFGNGNFENNCGSSFQMQVLMSFIWLKVKNFMGTTKIAVDRIKKQIKSAEVLLNTALYRNFVTGNYAKSCIQHVPCLKSEATSGVQRRNVLRLSCSFLKSGEKESSYFRSKSFRRLWPAFKLTSFYFYFIICL